MENTKTTKDQRLQSKRIGATTLIVVGAVLGVMGIGSSIIFSRNIEKFFWEARTKSVIATVLELSSELSSTDISNWSDPASEARLTLLGTGIKDHLPGVDALKIFTKDGTLAWTDLQNVKAGDKEAGIETELSEVLGAGHMVKEAGISTREELNETDLLEVWTVIKSPQEETIGYIEFYFNSSDIVSFIKQLQYSIWGGVTIVLLIIIFFLRLTFRQQNKIITEQAHELSDIFEQSPIGIYTIDKAGAITSVNSKMLEILNKKDSTEILNKNIFEIEHTQEINIGSEIREALLGKSFSKETIGKDALGNIKYQHYRGTPIIEDNSENISQILFTVEDITERKRLENEIAEHTKTLEESVAERTENLQQKIDELEQFQRLTIGREIRMTELKQEIERMRIKLESMGVKSDSI